MSCLLSLIAVVSLAQPPQGTPARDRVAPSPATGTASVAGIVTTDGETPVPLRRARVTLANPETRFNRTIVTDDTGRFVFTKVPAGRFTLQAIKEAYVPASYGARRPGGQGTALLVKDGAKVEGLTFRVTKGAVITGIVTDDTGQPMPDAQIAALQYGFVNGERRLVTRANARTDDRGVYRIFGLRAGQYVVASAHSRPLQMQNTPDILLASEADVDRAIKDPAAATQSIGVGRPGGFTSIYFPNATSPSQASVIELAAGEERTGIDIEVRMVPSGRVEGTVTAPDRDLPPIVQITLTVASEEGMRGMEGFRSGRADAEGKFQFGALTPGEYLATAVGNAPGGGADAALLAAVPVTVTSGSVTPVSLELRRGLKLSGRLVFDGAGPPPNDARGWSVNLTPVQSVGGVSMGVKPPETQADGTFVVSGLTPGRFRLQVSPPTPIANNWIVRSAVLAGRSVLDDPLEIYADMDGLVVTLSDRVPQLTGTLHDASGGQTSGYHVILFPADRALWGAQSPRVQAVRADSEGTYIFKKVLPGAYLVAATTDVEPTEWMDPGFLQRLAPGAIAISLAEGEQKVQDLQLGKR